MGFGKTFGLGFIVFILINLGLAVLFDIENFQFKYFANIYVIIGAMFWGAIIPPTLSFLLVFVTLLGYGNSITSGLTIDLPIILFTIIIVPLISSIITGRLANSKVVAFLAWFLISIISAIIYGIIIIIVLQQTLTAYQSIVLAFAGSEIMIIIIYGAINGVFYGSIAQLVNSEES